MFGTVLITHGRRSRGEATWMVSIASAVLLTACGSTVQDVSSPGRGAQIPPNGIDGPLAPSGPVGSAPLSTSPGSAPGPVASAVGTDGRAPSVGATPIGGSGPTTADPSNPGTAVGRSVGITASTVKMGVVIAAGNPGTAFGTSLSYDTDASTRIVQGMVNEINATGGIAGRKVLPIYAYNDNTDGSASAQTRSQTEICTRLTEDEKVFFVIAMNPAGLNYSYDCYAKHQTPLIDLLLADADAERLAQLSPWVIAPIAMNWGTMARVLPGALSEAGFLTQKMGLFTQDRPALNRSAKVLMGEIGKRGGRFLATATFKPTYDGLAADTAAAVLSFKDKGVDRVVVWAPQCGTLLAFSRQAQSQGYSPRYGLTTYQTPAFCAGLVDPSQLKDAAGAGFLMANDVSGSSAPPITPREKACFDTVKKRSGDNFTKRGASGSAGIALASCELLYFAQKALAPGAGRAIGNGEVAGYVARLGTSYQAVNVAKTSYGPNKLDGAQVYARLEYRTSCSCFGYVGGWRDI